MVPVLWIQGEKDIMWTVEEVAIDVLRNVELKIVPESCTYFREGE